MDKDIKNTAGDVAHGLAKGVLGMVPFAGSLAAEVFSMVIAPPIEKRKVEWMENVAVRLKELEAERNLDLNALKDNEQFIDAVLYATSFAIKTSVIEKKLAFQNAIINTALGYAPEKAISHIFLNQIDLFTVWHIKILNFIDDPEGWFSKSKINPPGGIMGGSLSHIIKAAFPELNEKDDLLAIIWKDLKDAGFHDTGSLNAMMTGSGLLVSRTTDFGKSFLKFISEQ